MRKGTTAAVVLAVGALALGGCSDGGDGPGAATSPATVGAAPAAGIVLADAGLSVAEARAWEGEGTIAVRAHLVMEPDGTARLCDAIRESSPPQCGGAAMPVADLPDELAAGLSEDAGRRWSEGPVQLMGVVREGVFVNDALALAAG